MPSFRATSEPPASVSADTLAVFATKREGDEPVSEQLRSLGDALEVDIAAELRAVGFEGDLGQFARIPTRGKAAAPLVLVVGVGNPGEATLDTLRKAAGAAARGAAKDATLAIVVPDDLPGGADTAARARVITEGAGLGAYAFTRYRTKTADLPSLEAVVLVADADLEPPIRQGSVVVEAVCLARDLVNTAPADKRPPALAERMAEALASKGVSVRIHDDAALREGGFGGILGVGQGSSEPPRLVEMTYQGEGDGHVVLVGKGITFDSGGLSLKPSQAMTTMKSDMAGAAAVAATLSACQALGIRGKVTGLAAIAENLPSGTAIRVSDVLTHRGGKTVEVLNTDAEGRLVLADALAYGAEQQPDVMIDLATLTGAQVVALGNAIAGIMGTDDGLIAALRGAGTYAGEQLWHLPLPPEYSEHLKSEVADLKNIGRPMQAGTLVAGLFLKEFTGGVPWAHLDIAGPAFTEDGDAYTLAKGGTGMGVRTLLRYLETR